LLCFILGIALLFVAGGGQYDLGPRLGRAIAIAVFVLFLFTFVVSLALGIAARIRIGRSEGRLKGKERALGAVIVSIVALCFLLLIPTGGGPGHRRMMNESAAISGLRTVSTAQWAFREGDKDGNAKLDFAPDLPSLARHQLIDPALGGGTKMGYIFSITRSGKDPENRWSATARPEKPGWSGTRYFYMDEGGVIRFETNGMAGPDSPLLR
jgi:hypothetical protein